MLMNKQHKDASAKLNIFLFSMIHLPGVLYCIVRAKTHTWKSHDAYNVNK